MKQIHFTVNDKNYDVLVEPHENLAKVLREKIGLTGTKIGCEQGACGACTVMVEDAPVLSCITPALRCNNAHILTIEGVATNGTLHPLQEKFVEKGAIQCGFCTPGMVMTALAFLGENPKPTTDEIKEAISGNLCRCTGYKKIIESIAEAAPLMKNQDEQPNEKVSIQYKIEALHNEVPSSNDEFQIIGKSLPYIDARKKVTGEAKYADDFQFKNALYCKFLRSVHPHARIESIDTNKAEKLHGIRYVLTGKEITEKFGILPTSQDQTALAIDKVKYVGEIVAVVVGDTEAIATEAVNQINVKYKLLKPYLTIQEALQLVGKVEEPIHPHCREGKNIHKKASLRFGDQKKGLDESAYRCRMYFEFDGLNHAFTEPHACTAYCDTDGNLTLISSTQVPHYVHRILSKVLKIPIYKIRVIKPFLGGGFGGKSDPFAHEIIAAYLAKKIGTPVKVRLSREEVFLTNHGRHPTQLNMELGIDEKGKFKVIDADIKIDGGAYGSFGVVTTYYNGVLLQAPYKIDNFGFDSCRVYTNKPPCGAMRGHGAVNPRFAIEVVIDELAHQMGIDPCEIRFKNFLPSNTHTVGQFRITSNGVREALDTVMNQSEWKKRYGKLPYGIGLGVACGFYISGSALPIIWNEYPQTAVHIKVDFDGRVVVYSGASDIGQGSDTILAMIVAEVLGLKLDKIYIHSADTLMTPVDLGTYSSRVTFMVGNAVKMAAENLKKEIIKRVSKKKRAPQREISVSSQRFISKDGKVNLSWQEAIDIATANKGAITASGYYISPKLGGNFKGAGAGLSPSYSFGAVVAEVKVNTETGHVKVENLWGAHDCGKALNRLAVEGQLEGSWHMGMGQALSEAMKYHKGLVVNPNILDYKIPTAMDIPDFHTNIIESCDPEGPFGAKECGEGALHPAVPAIANAVFDAVGVRITNLPISPETILKGIKTKRKIEILQ
jgi:4-hydroxybenzoyl-CoA reductase alpha subunit